VNMTIQQWLTQLVPLPQIVQITGQVMPAFVIVGAFILAIGYMMMLAGSESAAAPSARLIMLFAAIAASPWFLSIGQAIVNALVGAIAGADPQISWLVVNNPGDASLVMDFTKPFQVIGQFVGGTFANTSGIQWWEVGKWIDYIIRGAVIAIVGGFAAFTVFVMEVMLMLQKLILLGSRPLMPIFIACLSIGAAEGSAQNFLKSVLGVMCWPIGWALVHIGTMAAIQNLHPPSWTAALFQLVVSGLALGVVCLWMIVGTVGAPFLIAKMVRSGSNFAHAMVSNFAGVAGQHAGRGVRAGSTVAGALVGSAAGGAPGVVVGASVGALAGEALSMPIGSVMQSVEGVREGRQPVSSSRSRAAADAAIAFIKGR
jgi:hypothetical protein